MTFGCIHIAWNHKRATEHAVKQFRKYHSNNPYTLISDNGFDYSELSKKYNLNYIHSYLNCHPMRLHGHSHGIYGITKNECLGWIHYFREGCKHVLKNGGTHIILMEDDIHTQSEVIINPEWEVAGHYFPETQKIEPKVLEWIRKKYNVNPNQDWYGAGGGAIFKVKTFLDNYHKIYDFFDDDFDLILETMTPEFGWCDYFLTVAYFICGKDYSVNDQLTEMPLGGHVSQSGSYFNKLENEFALLHKYKRYYDKVGY